MTILARTLTFALVLCTPALQAQQLRWGVDGILGIHYNTMDAASYKTPIGCFGAGGHISVVDPDNPTRLYFNGRLTLQNDFQTHVIVPGISLDCGLRDLVTSLQACKQLTEKLSAYAGLNFSFHLYNSAYYRANANVFTNLGLRSEQIEAQVRQKVRKLNAGLEAGCLYSLGKSFSTGLSLTYYALKRMNQDIELEYQPTPQPGSSENVTLNFRPLALRVHCMLEF